MKKVSYLLGAIGTLLFVYAFIGRFIQGPAVNMYVYGMEAKTVVLGANTILLLAILAALCARDSKPPEQK